MAEIQQVALYQSEPPDPMETLTIRVNLPSGDFGRLDLSASVEGSSRQRQSGR